jgi:hypothetical protein
LRSSRRDGQKKHIWNVQFGVRMRELCLRQNICLGYQYFRWLAEEGAVLHENELSVLSVRDRNFR